MAQMYDSIRDFKQLAVYQKSMELTKLIYKLTEGFPTHEQYAVTSQMRRAVTSIAANIAEGNGQCYPAKELTFVNTSIGSASETRHWLLFSSEVGYIEEKDYERLDAVCTEILKMLYGYMKRIKKEMEKSA